MTQKTTKAPLFLGGCGCVSILLSFVLLGAFFVSRGEPMWSMPGWSNPDLSHYTNSPVGRTGNLADHYVDFEFDYPSTWLLKPQEPDSPNYVSVERSIGSDTCENFNVGYFQTTGSIEGNRLLYPVLIAQLQSQFEQQFPGLEKVEEGPTQIGSYEGFHALFQSQVESDSDPVDIYVRTVLLPTPDGTRGVLLVMIGTSACPALSQPSDLGVAGELPIILNSFRFGE